MKTLESIMRSIARSEEEKSSIFTPRKCEKCGVMEGKKSLDNSETITLTKMQDEGREMLVCQKCTKSKIIKTKKTAMEKLKKYITTIFGILVIMIVSSGYINAQPPGLPGDPSQAPIDGGLSLLAIAGGAYAYKKLRNNKE